MRRKVFKVFTNFDRLWPLRGIIFIASSYFFILGVEKKIVAVSKRHKSCAMLKDWAHSISNFLYWCASSSGGDGDLCVAKWKSITNHVTNIHTGHSELFPQCMHGDIQGDKAWLPKGNEHLTYSGYTWHNNMYKNLLCNFTSAKNSTWGSGMHYLSPVKGRS